MNINFKGFAARLGLPLLLLIPSVILNVALAQKIKSQRYRIAYLSSEGPQVGAAALPIEVMDLRGTRHVIAYSDSSLPTVLYVFSPSCHWCAQNVSNLKSLGAAVSDKYRFVGISLTTQGLKEHLREVMPDNFLIYTSPSETATVAYRFGGTPETLVVSREGKVIKRWRGAWTGDSKADIENFFQHPLPGLLSAPQYKVN
jgi:hypothetical protein